MIKTTMFPDTLHFMEISTIGLSFIQSLLLSVIMNGMMRGAFVHGSFKMTWT
jgi:hypothetical protein